jgi:glucose-1-phosphate thymidylyltransferase
MRIIVPMAGRGSRLRPHTLTTAKPLLPIAGKPIVQHLVEDIASIVKEDIEEIAFVIGDFGAEVERQLIDLAEKVGAKGKIYYQAEPLGTAHAIMCAAPSLSGHTVIAFADTLFRADFTMDHEKDGVIWVKQVDDPSAFGVVQLSDNGQIIEFVEKPESFVSDLAIIGIYFFKDGQNLRKEIQYLLDNNIKVKGEFQLTSALENMKEKGKIFVPGKVNDWMDCGNKDVTVETNGKILNYLKEQDLLSPSASIVNSKIIQPCYIGENARIENSTVGPNVSVGNGTIIERSTIDNSIIMENSSILNADLTNSMIGNYVKYNGNHREISLGDYSQFK